MGIELNNDQILAACKLEHWWKSRYKQAIGVGGGAGTGKAQPVDTHIPTPDRGHVLLEDLKVGDYVFNRNGNPVKVLGVFDQGALDVYSVNLADGRSTRCNDEHLWAFYINDKKDLSDRVVGTTREIMNYLVAGNRIFIDVNGPITQVAPHETEDEKVSYSLIEHIVSSLKLGVDSNGILYSNACMPDEESINITDSNILAWSLELRFDLLKSLLENEFYQASKAEYENYDRYFISARSYRVAKWFQMLICSLGFSAYMSSQMEVDGNGSWLIRACISRELYPEIKPSSHVEIIGVVKLEYKKKMRCIYVDDPEHLYLTNDYIVTHNTTMILYFIQRIGLDLDEVLFVSYMGKAVSRMIQTGLPAKTIHATCYTYEKQVALDENGKMIIGLNGKPKMIFVPILRERLPKKIKLIVADEAYTIPERNAVDLESFGLPIVAVGDPNQLEPPFGRPYFLSDGIDIMLHQIMRQAEGNPIIYLAQQVLAHKPLREGTYGTSSVVKKSNLTDYALRSADIILTSTNRLRGSINNLFRESFMDFTNLDIPHVGEKLICRANDWSRFLNIGDGEIYLTNGTTGFVDYVDKRSYSNKSIKLDFRPDYGKRAFHGLKVDLTRLNAPLGSAKDAAWTPPDMNCFEYGYALTTYSAQGSQWDNVLVLDEGVIFNVDKYYRSLYVAITRAIKSLTIALP